MKLRKLFKALRDSRILRKRRRIRFCIRFFIDDNSYVFAFIPTIIFIPWPYRELGMPIFQFYWLNFGISFGEWDART